MKKTILFLAIAVLLPLKLFAVDLSKEDCIALMIVPEVIGPGIAQEYGSTDPKLKKLEKQAETYNAAKMQVYKEGGCSTAFTELQELISAKLKK